MSIGGQCRWESTQLHVDHQAREHPKKDKGKSGLHSMDRWWILSHTLMTEIVSLLRASVRNSARVKGHEEGGSTYAKAGLSLRSPPGNSWASIPITRACLLYYFVLSPTPLTLLGLSPTTSFGEGVNLELHLIIIPEHDQSVSTFKLLWRFSSLPDRLLRPHVIAYSLPTVRGTRGFKPSKTGSLENLENY